MLLENWEHDQSSLDMLNYFRISSNAVYPFKSNGNIRLLRFSPSNEKEINNIKGELEFIRYLKSKGYPALSTVASKNNQELLEANTPWGNYFAVVFDRVPGVQLGELDLDYTCAIAMKHGKYLGKLHKLSSKYRPIKILRHSYEDVLVWAETQLLNLNGQLMAVKEVSLLKEFFKNLHRNEQNFGLIHYDFEPDNIFYDQDVDAISVIDFDDAMYHWYVMDICQSLDSILSDSSYKDFSIVKDSFIKGYTMKNFMFRMICWHTCLYLGDLPICMGM